MKIVLRIAFVTLALVASCSENALEPQNDAAGLLPTAATGGATQALTVSDTARFGITIDPSRVTYFYLGAGNSITFPAHSLCDPTKSSYGPTEWDKPCTGATQPVTVQVKAWLDSTGHPRVDFNPSVRFAPSSTPLGWVVLTFADREASLDPMFDIRYCATSVSACANEALTDATLRTAHDPITGRVTRRIKHFSGYNVAAGAVDDPSAAGQQ